MSKMAIKTVAWVGILSDSRI